METRISAMVTRIGSKKPGRLYIAEWREAKGGLTQQALADRVGTTKGTISRWESGERDPPLSALYALGDALGVDPGDLFHDPRRPSQAELLKQASPEEWQQALTVVRALRKTGT